MKFSTCSESKKSEKVNLGIISANVENHEEKTTKNESIV